MMGTPTIQPIKLKESEVKQSKYDIVPKIQFKSVMLAPVGSGGDDIIVKCDTIYLKNWF